MTSPTRNLAIKLATSVVAGSTACAAFVALALAADKPSLAKGMVTGGSLALAAFVALSVIAHVRRDAPPEARLATGLADERDRRLATRAAAHAAIAMYAVSVGGVMALAFGASGIAVLGCVMWAGLLAAGLSFIVSVRRG